MFLKNGQEEFDLKYQTAAYVALKSKLKCGNLRQTLLQAANREDYETLAETLKMFSIGKISKTSDAYPIMDQYIEENGISAYEMFLQLITEIGEAGFFKEKLTLEQVQEMAQSPDLDIDMDEMAGEAMKAFKSRMISVMAEKIADSTLATGANTSMPSVPPLTAVE